MTSTTPGQSDEDFSPYDQWLSHRAESPTMASDGHDEAPTERPRSFDNPLFADTSSPRRPADEALFPAPQDPAPRDPEPPTEQPPADESDPEPPAEQPEAADTPHEKTETGGSHAAPQATPEPGPDPDPDPEPEPEPEPDPVPERSEDTEPAVETTVAQARTDETDRRATTPTASTDSARTETRPGRLRSASAGLDVSRVRQLMATIVWAAAIVAALLLASAALIIVLGDVNRSNPLVRFVLDTANAVDLGVFDRRGDGVFVFDGKNAGAKNAVVNWGLAAITYLLAGRILSRFIKP